MKLCLLLKLTDQYYVFFCSSIDGPSLNREVALEVRNLKRKIWRTN